MSATVSQLSSQLASTTLLMVSAGSKTQWHSYLAGQGQSSGVGKRASYSDKADAIIRDLVDRSMEAFSERCANY